MAAPQVAATPMPGDFAAWTADIACNDCNQACLPCCTRATDVCLTTRNQCPTWSIMPGCG